jgi:transposase
VIHRYKMAKHVQITIAGGRLTWTRDVTRIQQEAQLDGFYVIRTNVAVAALTAPDAARQYKAVARVERAFRCLKRIDMRIRPIHQRTNDHVRAHVFLCVLAYYVERHLRQA